jgi:hypothetical protein
MSLEQPVETAMLMTLAGIKCYYGNLWHCSLKENAFKTERILKGTFHNVMVSLLSAWRLPLPSDYLLSCQELVRSL